MARHVLLVYSEPVPGQEDEYNEWYDGLHLDELLQFDGIVSAERFDFLAHEDFPKPERSRLAIYDVETDNPHDFLRRLLGATESMTVSPSIDIKSVRLYAFESRQPHRNTSQ
ncbi:hypothetical protein [Mycobacterium vicinigordonae]|uniref:DUF4286 family protein n=1 Tax=Mycobacterium vicinigordonae TaxID=1719132 RepID=A0A7D6I7D2_9MYCO|nr:hypothetical protein [Mycobacterium vicinigordonae]QLL08718.1 hypothetical protein H0P51_07330 [Mycobacterium vicinigordonae]